MNPDFSAVLVCAVDLEEGPLPDFHRLPVLEDVGSLTQVPVRQAALLQNPAAEGGARLGVEGLGLLRVKALVRRGLVEGQAPVAQEYRVLHRLPDPVIRLVFRVVWGNLMPVLPGQLFQQRSQGGYVLLRPQKGQVEKIGPRRVAGFTGESGKLQIQLPLFGEVLQGPLYQDSGVIGLVAGPILRPFPIGGGAEIQVRLPRRGKHILGRGVDKGLSEVLLQPLGGRLRPALRRLPGGAPGLGASQVDAGADGEKQRQDGEADHKDGLPPEGIAPPGVPPGALCPGRPAGVRPLHPQEAVKGLVGRVLGGVLKLVGIEDGPADLRGQVRALGQKVLQEKDKIHVGPDAQKDGAVQKPPPLGRGRVAALQKLQGPDRRQDGGPGVLPVQLPPLAGLGGVAGPILVAQVLQPPAAGFLGLLLPLGEEALEVPLRGRFLLLRGRVLPLQKLVIVPLRLLGLRLLRGVVRGFLVLKKRVIIPAGGLLPRQLRGAMGGRGFLPGLAGPPGPAAGLLIGGVKPLEALWVLLGVGGFQLLGVSTPDVRQTRRAGKAQLVPGPAHRSSSSSPSKGSGGDRAASPR